MSPAQKTPSDRHRPAAGEAGPSVDERLRKTSIVTEAMRRPELGAIAGLIVVLIFFFFTASPTMFTLSGADDDSRARVRNSASWRSPPLS